MNRTPTVTLAAHLAALAEAGDCADAVALTEASQRLLALRRLLDAALHAVELFADTATLQQIKLELGL